MDIFISIYLATSYQQLLSTTTYGFGMAKNLPLQVIDVYINICAHTLTHSHSEVMLYWSCSDYYFPFLS